MIVFGFYGDDHLGGWPLYANNYHLYDDSDNILRDFISFCVNVFGMRYKWHEYAIFDDVYSLHQFETLPNGAVVEVAGREGPTFLKNQVSHTYLDGVYLGAYPYRATGQLMAKVGFSLTAMKNPHMHMCLLASLARLSSGNLEAFSQIRIAYEYFSGLYGEPGIDIWNAFFDSKTSGSIRSVVKERLTTFPLIHELHMRQNLGYEQDTGFPAFNSKGDQVDGRAYYNLDVDLVDFIQSRYAPEFDSDSDL